MLHVVIVAWFVVMGYPITLHRRDRRLFAYSKANTYWPATAAVFLPSLRVGRSPRQSSTRLRIQWTLELDTDLDPSQKPFRSFRSHSVLASFPKIPGRASLAQATAIFRIKIHFRRELSDRGMRGGGGRSLQIIDLTYLSIVFGSASATPRSPCHLEWVVGD